MYPPTRPPPAQKYQDTILGGTFTMDTIETTVEPSFNFHPLSYLWLDWAVINDLGWMESTLDSMDNFTYGRTLGSHEIVGLCRCHHCPHWVGLQSQRMGEESLREGLSGRTRFICFGVRSNVKLWFIWEVYDLGLTFRWTKKLVSVQF